MYVFPTRASPPNVATHYLVNTVCMTMISHSLNMTKPSKHAFLNFYHYIFFHVYSYILNVPLEGANDTSSAIVYAWIGNNSDADSARLIEQIAEEKFNNPWVSLQVITIL